MKKRNINIISVVILIFLAIFLYVNNKNTKDNAKAPTASASATPAAVQTTVPVNSPAGTISPQSTPAATSASEQYKTETIKDFNLTINLPQQWVKKTQYDNRYEGDSGFAELTAMSGYGLSLKEAADVQINHELKPLGDSPTLISTTVESQEALIITPSGNDPKAQCAIITKFPSPISISGTPYYYLIIWADRGHAEKLSGNIKFIK